MKNIKRLLEKKFSPKLFLRGMLTISLLVFTNISVFGQITVLEEARYNTTGVHRTLIILANFQDDPSEVLTIPEAEDIVLNTVNAYYQENSYGKMSLIGQAIGWYTLPISKSEVSCTEINQLFTEPLKAVDPDVYFPDYDSIIIFMDLPSGCFGGAAGFGSSGYSSDDGPITATTAIVNINRSDRRIAGTTAHEIGHTLGLNHANFLECGNKSIKSSGCVEGVYQDEFDVMGRSKNMQHFNAAHKYQVGWFEPENIVVINSSAQSGRYTIDPIEMPSTGVQALKIFQSADVDGFNSWYYVEYRQPIGFDEYLFSTYPTAFVDVINGALVHIGSHKSINNVIVQTQTTKLLDMSPHDNTGETQSEYYLDLYSPTLLAGQTFDDGFNRVTLVSNDVAYLTVDVAVASCGDNICQANEGYSLCEMDCPSPTCGDGFCSAMYGEDGVTCQPDCSVTCGDNICQADEGYNLCEMDCPSSNCGDGF
ncbi:RTX toxins and related Ca2+-binding proteins, partial [hydrothermal vent metagenome]